MFEVSMEDRMSYFVNSFGESKLRVIVADRA